MTDALRAVAGDGLKDLLARSTSSRLRGVVTGTLVTAAIQSSTVTTVLLVGFIGAGLMTLEQAVPLILGANVGTTLSAQIIAFNVTQYGLLLLALGFFAGTFAKRASVRQWGWIVMGLGVLFLGMDIMNNAMRPLRTYEPFVEFMKSMERPFVGFLVGAVFTVLVQSSLATTSIVIVLGSQGFVTLEAGIPLILGANVGTCATALLAAVGKPPAARQAALVHTLFNALGALAWLPLVGLLAAAAREISPSAVDLEGAARLAADVPRQVANSHLLFNIANTLIALPFTASLAALARRLAPDRPSAAPARFAPVNLDPAFLTTPALAIEAARREVWRMAEEAIRLVREAPKLLRSGSEPDAAAVMQMFENVETLHDAVTNYLSAQLIGERVERDGVAAEQVLEIAHYVRSAAEIVAGNLVELIREAAERGAAPSAETAEVLRELHQRVADLFEEAVHAVRDKDGASAQRVIGAKAEIDALIARAQQQLLAGLGADAPARALLFRLESSAVEHLKRVYYFAKRIAKLVAPLEAGDLRR